MIEYIEQLVFEGMKPIDKKMKKPLFKEVKDLLKNYHLSTIRLESLMLKKQLMTKRDENLEGEIKHISLFVERVEQALKACSDLQKEILILGCGSRNHLYDYEIMERLNIRGKETWDREKTSAFFNFASAFGIYI